MKDKIVTFIAGLLIGAIISTASIYVYVKADNKNDSSNKEHSVEMFGGNRDGGRGQMNNNGNMTPPEIPDNTQQENN